MTGRTTGPRSVGTAHQRLASNAAAHEAAGLSIATTATTRASFQLLMLEILGGRQARTEVHRPTTISMCAGDLEGQQPGKDRLVQRGTRQVAEHYKF